MKQIITRVKNIILWIIVGFLALIALSSIPSLACIIAALVALLIVPIEQWQSILHKFIKGKIKAIVIVVLTVLMLITFPTNETANESHTPATVATTNVVAESTTEVPTQAPAETTTAPTTEPTTAPTTEPTTVPTTEPTTAPTTEPTTAPTTEPTAAPTAEPTAAPTTDPTTAPTTEPTTAPTTEPTTEPPHIHDFSPATCTKPKTCVCGATEGDANGHNWKDATYSAPKTCTACGITEGSPKDVPNKENYHGHVYTGGEKSTKYHYEADCAKKNSHEITWDEVERRGLGPCGTCVLK